MTHRYETIAFDAYDGIKCNLRHLVNDGISKCPVLLVHGAGVRANIFDPPTDQNLITMLAREGYDVWLENWRGSIDLEPQPWDLDQVALNDHPAAVKKVVELTGKEEIKAIIHCQGSTSFMISAALGLVPQVRTIISNAVSLHPVVSPYSLFKINYYLPFVKLFFDYLNPAWGLHAPDLKSKALCLLVAATHREKDTLVGKFVSFTYGAGWPALWLLENLNKKTMDWIQYEFAEVPLTFFDHMKKCLHKGALMPADPEHSANSYVETPPKTDARVVLFAGAQNLCFHPDSQRKTFEYLQGIRPGIHKLYILENYSHLDVFFGKNADKDIFPIMIKELNQN
ncbi:MAG: alpha/beta hydrolase [Cyclobacteriaceae bacterium]|nr:alpha/beta hydrolase [Cyclobacteriaceae bacterium]